MQDNPDLTWDGNTQKGKIKHKPSVDKNGKNHLGFHFGGRPAERVRPNYSEARTR